MLHMTWRLTPVLASDYTVRSSDTVPRCHTGPMNGHQGMEKTRLKLQETAYWKGWNGDVHAYVQRCNVCNSYRYGPRWNQRPLQQALACDIMQKVHVDLVRPFPLSRKSFQYLLTAICGFMMNPICVPIHNKLSISVANALMRHIYLVYNLLKILVHDHDGWVLVGCDETAGRHIGY